MKIGIDARMIGHSGIGVRLEHLLKHFPKDSCHEFFLFGRPDLLAQYHFPFAYTAIDYPIKIYHPKEFWGHPVMAEMDLLDIPHFNVPLRYLTKCLVTIHDIIPYQMKQFFPSVAKRVYIRSILTLIKKYSRRVITVSQFTANDLTKVFAYPPEKLQVIYNGVDHQVFFAEPMVGDHLFCQQYQLPEHYFLTVGIGKEHKNIQLVIHSLEKLALQYPHLPPLVIAGTGGKIPKYLQDLVTKNQQRIIICPRLPYEQLRLLYQNAIALLYPSLYEGFGFPVVEAQACGTTVFSANASVLPEILQDTAFYFDPYRQESLIELLKMQLDRPDTTIRLRQKGIENAHRFQWQTAVQQLFQLYDRLASE